MIWSLESLRYCGLVIHHSRTLSHRVLDFSGLEVGLYARTLVASEALRPMQHARRWLNVVLRLEMRFVSP